MHTKGSPPKTLTGQLRVSASESPWWARTASELSSPHVLGGKVLSIEELSQFVPPYPDGRRARPRTVARRLRSILELVSRGPNGSRGKGAVYRVITPAPPPSPGEDDTPIDPDVDWLQQSVDRMTGGK